MIFKKDVFWSSKYYPLGWEECLNIAKDFGYKYINFNGKVFDVMKSTSDIEELDYTTAICDDSKIISNKIWFTSDTHFGSQRTLELSKRPFSSVEEMDKTLIEHWNNVVGKYDKVYHLGDFGDFKNVNKLKGDVILLYGNYEREIQDLKSNTLIDFGFSKILNPDNPKNIELLIPRVNDIDLNLILSHEPSFGLSNNILNNFKLFGHIHGLQKVKRNGLNVGTDCHQFTPIDLDTVLFYKNAIENHYDEEVFMSLEEK